MCAMRAHIKHLGHVGFAQPRRGPEALAGTLQASLTPRTGRQRSPLLGPGGAGGRSAAQASAEQRLGSSPRLGKAAAGAAASPAPARPSLTQRSWTPTREAGSRLHARSRAQQGPANDEPGGPEGHRYFKLLPIPNSPSQAPLRCFVIFQAARVVILTMGTGPLVPTFEAGGAGDGRCRLGCKSLPFCRCCSPSPPAAPLHRFFFLSAAQLLWVTRAVAMGYRTEAAWLATCHPVSAAGGGAARAGGGGSARVRDAAPGVRASGGGAAANRQPGGQPGSATARGVGWGTKL